MWSSWEDGVVFRVLADACHLRLDRLIFSSSAVYFFFAGIYYVNRESVLCGGLLSRKKVFSFQFEKEEWKCDPLHSISTFRPSFLLSIHPHLHPPLPTPTCPAITVHNITNNAIDPILYPILLLTLFSISHHSPLQYHLRVFVIQFTQSFVIQPCSTSFWIRLFAKSHTPTPTTTTTTTTWTWTLIIVEVKPTAKTTTPPTTTATQHQLESTRCDDVVHSPSYSFFFSHDTIPSCFPSDHRPSDMGVIGGFDPFQKADTDGFFDIFPGPLWCSKSFDRCTVHRVRWMLDDKDTIQGGLEQKRIYFHLICLLIYRLLQMCTWKGGGRGLHTSRTLLSFAFVLA